MIADNRAQIEENLIKAILFVLITIFVLIFIIKILTQLNYTPGWSRSLTAVEKAIENLDKENLELTRTANVQFTSDVYYIEGFNEISGMCPVNKEKPNCICFCKNTGCTNIDSNINYCKSIAYPLADDFLINDAKAPKTFSIILEKIGDTYQVNVLGISG